MKTHQLFNANRPSDRRLLAKAMEAINKYFGGSAGPMAPVVRVHELVPCSRCTSDIYCEMNGCQHHKKGAQS